MKTMLKILILEDVKDDVGLIERVLKKDGISFVIHQVDTRDEFIDGLKKFDPDVILSDHALPQFNSIEALKLCKESGSKVPFILVTGTVSEEFAVNCLKQGADDYVLKSNLSRLPSAILTSIRHHDMEDEKQKAETSLFRQNSELIKINKELDTFVYNVSHNLRSPLSSLLGLINLAKREYDQAVSLEAYFKMMESSVLKLDSTLKEILEYSQNSRNEIAANRINLSQIFHDCLRELSYLPGQLEIEKSVTITGDSKFYSDHHRLSVLFRNLISNSLKYRDPKKPKQILLLSATVSDTEAIIRIEDNGIGIQDNLLPRVYEMFYRATEHSDGAGLGLYIAKEIVQMLRGRISIQSEANQGTAVTLTIPNLLTGPG